MAQAPTGLGKCISGDSLLFTSNGLVAIKDFVYGKTNSLSSNNIFLREGELIKIGKEKILKIKTRHGYEIKSTFTHKFLTPEGWKCASDIKPGDFVATSRKFLVQESLPKPFEIKNISQFARKITIPLTKEMAYFVGAFIGDGSYNGRVRVRFTLKNLQIVENLNLALRQIGLKFSVYKDCNYNVDSIVLKKFLESMGSPDFRTGRKGGKCSKVFIDNKILCLPIEHLASFLRGLFDTDGYVEKDNYIAFTSKSYDLIKGLKFALLRFGIISQLSIKKNPKYGIYHILRITGRSSIHKFSKTIGFSVVYKQRRLENFLNLCKKENPNIDSIPLEKDLVLKLRKYVRWSNNKSLYNLLICYYYGQKTPTHVSISRLINHCKQFSSTSDIIATLESKLNSDILWDRVVLKEDAGIDNVYDLSVPNTHNFISEGFVAHNSDAALSAAITYALENNLTVFFLTPKISQHKIAIEVVAGLAKKHDLKQLRAVDMLGRLHGCIDDSLAALDGEGFHTACSKKRKDQTCTYYGNAKGYNKLQESKADSRFRVIIDSYGAAKPHSDIVSIGRAAKSCPYEWLIKLAECSNVIIADYYHLMIPQIREIFLLKTKKRIEDSIIIVDEAHNLASRVRSSLSFGISSFTLRRVSREMRVLGLDAGPLEETFSEWAVNILQKEREKEVKPRSFLEFISAFGISLDQVLDQLEKAGEAYIEKTGKKSACLKLAQFLSNWNDEELECVRVLKKQGEFYFLSKKLLDPSPSTKILNLCRGSILMSGSLLPLEMHRDVLGLDPKRTIMKTYPSQFSSDSAINIVTPDVTTRYSKRDADEYLKIAQKIDSIYATTPGGVAAFFPSYKVMDQVLRLMISSPLHIQQKAMKPSDIRDLLRHFRNEGGILCAVQGGSLSEGVDYSNGEIKTVVIIGVGLDEMGIENKALIDYYEEKFGRGWDYGYLYPGTIKALQAAGRARRKDEDRAAIIYMDERFQWNKYNWIIDKKEKIIVSTNPELEVEKFWKNKK